MSRETLSALDDAIRAHIADESHGQDLTVHWALVVGVMTDDEDEEDAPFWTLGPEGQPTYIATGLWHEALHRDRPGSGGEVE